MHCSISLTLLPSLAPASRSWCADQQAEIGDEFTVANYPVIVEGTIQAENMEKRVEMVEAVLRQGVLKRSVGGYAPKFLHDDVFFVHSLCFASAQGITSA